MARIKDLYIGLYDSEQAVTKLQTYPDDFPPIMAWEVKSAQRKLNNGKEAGKDKVNVDT